MTYPQFIVALCLWREARNQSSAAREGVAAVVRNRNRMAPAQGFQKSPAAEVTRPWQFTSMSSYSASSQDPNLSKWPAENDPVFADCCRIATADGLPDPVGGAVFYHDSSLNGPPMTWGNVELTVRIGALSFYRIGV